MTADPTWKRLPPSLKMFLLLLIAIFATAASAQTVIDYSKLPQCAHSCTILQQAETGCVPPAAPVTGQATYQSCVCQSALLTTLKSSGALCQQTGCSAGDANTISQYYISLCNGPVVEPTTTTSLSSTTTTGTSTATGTTTASASTGSKAQSSSANNSWFANHWRWIVMVIVIFVAIVVIWVAGICIRRRYHRKREAQRANMAAADAYRVDGNTSTGGPLHRGKAPGPVTPPPPMTMSGGRSGYGGIDGNDSGIAPPRRPRKPRRRSTLQSIAGKNDSHTSIGQPVVWGPHQHQAHGRDGMMTGNSPEATVPPSPTLPGPPNPVFINDRAMRSEPRFTNYSHKPKSPIVQTTSAPPVSPIEEMPRPGTAPNPERRVASPFNGTKPKNSLARTSEEVEEGGVSRKTSKKLSKRMAKAAEI